MKIVHALLLAPMLVACSTQAGAQQQPAQQPAKQEAPSQAKPAEASLAGEYELSGVMETGSGLLLRGDGSFEWYFSYGALDLGARGKWTRKGDVVELAVAEMGFPPQMQAKANEVAKGAMRGLEAMRKAKVKVGYGTDLLGELHVQQCREFDLRREVFTPLELLRPIPAVAWIPLAILMFPSSEASMIFITFTGALFPILLNTVHGVESVDPRLVASARSLACVAF